MTSKFTPNKSFNTTHLNIKSAIDFAKNFHQILAIVQRDFHKAFIVVSHCILLQTALQLGILSLLKWIQIFVSDLTFKVNLNSYPKWLINLIPVKKDIRRMPS